MKESIDSGGELSSYERFQRALEAEEDILRRMRALLEESGDRREAERSVLRELADKVDAAMKESREAWARWMADVERDVK